MSWSSFAGGVAWVEVTESKIVDPNVHAIASILRICVLTLYMHAETVHSEWEAIRNVTSWKAYELDTYVA